MISEIINQGLEEKVKDKEKFLLDTNVVFDHERELPYYFNGNSKEEYLLSPSVRKELGTYLERALLSKGVHTIETEKRKLIPYQSLAEKMMKKTHKHQTALFLLRIVPYVKGKKIPSYREKAKVEELLKEVNRPFKRKGQDPIENPKEMEKYLKRHWLVSQEDIDLLAQALYVADQGKHINIVSGDNHIKEALDICSREKPKLKRYIKITYM